MELPANATTLHDHHGYLTYTVLTMVVSLFYTETCHVSGWQLNLWSSLKLIKRRWKLL